MSAGSLGVDVKVNKLSIVRYVCIFFVMLTAGCFNLDPFLFSGQNLNEYQFDNVTSEIECRGALDQLGPMPDSERTEIALHSGKETIAAVILGKKSKYSSSDTMILYFHGNASNIDHYWARTRMLYASGFPVMVIDYRGFGKSTGSPSEAGLFEDGLAALDYIRDSLGNPNVVIYSYSLGSLVGCELASKYNIAPVHIIQLILEAPIGSIETIGEDGSYLNIPGSYLSSYTANNAEKIRNVSIPLLWLHGTDDNMLARSTQGQPIWDNYSGTGGYYVVIEGGGHSTIPNTMGYSNYMKCIKDFIVGDGASNKNMHAK